MGWDGDGVRGSWLGCYRIGTNPPLTPGASQGCPARVVVMGVGGWGWGRAGGAGWGRAIRVGSAMLLGCTGVGWISEWVLDEASKRRTGRKASFSMQCSTPSALATARAPTNSSSTTGQLSRQQLPL